MSIDVEAAANLAEASMVASVLEDGENKDAHSQSCANCHAPLTGPYCAQCGQKGHLHRSMLHLGEELLHGLLHFDAKGWRTMPMLIWNPGELTRRYIDGQRARFVSPLALYLFMVFFMFFVVSWTVGAAEKAMLEKKASGQVQFELERTVENEKRIKAELDAKLAALKAKGEDYGQLTEELVRNSIALETAEGALAARSTKSGKANQESSISTIIKEIGKQNQIDTGWPWLDKGLKHAVENPDLALYKLKSNAYKYAFLLVPISVPFIWLMFPFRRGVTMYDHAVFTLYSLSFMSLLFVVIAVLSRFDLDTLIALLIFVAAPLHMYRQLRGTYGVGRLGGILRTMTLVIVAFVVLSLYAMVVLTLSAA